MAYSISIAGANAVLDSFLTPFANGVIEIRNGIRPANPDTAATGVVLATVPLGVTPFAAAASRSADLNVAVADLLGDANGTATWFRMYDNAIIANAAHILDGDVGALLSGADMILDDGAGGSNITTVDRVTINSLAVTI